MDDIDELLSKVSDDDSELDKIISTELDDLEKGNEEEIDIDLSPEEKSALASAGVAKSVDTSSTESIETVPVVEKVDTVEPDDESPVADEIVSAEEVKLIRDWIRQGAN